ncbi:MAG: dihydroneopterin aldolase [Clostridiales bacterium 43-6]|nr:MAG: dihydroneopterin aldolase [Clostridiales bacterium 43-6]
MDTIMIKGLTIFAYHGVNEEEKRNGQSFVLDILIKTDIKKACISDDLKDTVSYSAAAKKAVAVMTAEKYDLIERAAEVVAQSLLESFPAIREVEVTLKKPQAPIKAEFDYVAVKITRGR